MENEEIRGLVNKKASEDQLASSWPVQVWSSLIILSLSHSWSLRVFLEHPSFGSRKENQEKGRKARIKEEERD